METGRRGVLEESDLPFPLLHRGKVRELYDLDEYVLLLASDRISAYDCVLPDPIPMKGEVLTQISRFWFRMTEGVVPNHLVSAEPDEMIRLAPELEETRDRWAWRSMLVRPATPYPVEWVVRGYLAGSAWREYRERGAVVEHDLPPGMEESEELPEPLFTPATKAEEGHDENISFEELADRVGRKLAVHLRDKSLALYRAARRHAREKGLLLADTKFEFGFTSTGEILLIDEVLTPDSSRFWPADRYEPGRSQPSLDKQPVRDHLDDLVEEGRWNREPPAPSLSDEVVEATTRRYLEVFRQLTGRELPSLHDEDA
jgi:phosphoribosylaminoimidazole-succinocarboxamide synthase